MLPLVSVVIPNYNNAEFLKDSIDSVKAQTYSNIEILVVDDCSTDTSLEVLSELLLTTPHLKIYKNDHNKGVSFSRNQGVVYATGDYITTLDPDDVYYPDKIEREMNLILSKRGENVVVYSGFNSVDEELHEIPFKSKLTKFNSANGFIFKKLLYMSIPVPRDMLFSKEQFFSVGGFDENMKLYEDWDFKLKLASKYKFYYSGSRGVKYRRHSNGLSAVDFSKHKIVMKDVFLKHAAVVGGIYPIFRIINGRGLLSKAIKIIIYTPIFNFLK